MVSIYFWCTKLFICLLCFFYDCRHTNVKLYRRMLINGNVQCIWIQLRQCGFIWTALPVFAPIFPWIDVKGPVGCFAKFSKKMLKAAYGGDMILQLDILAVSIPTPCFLKTRASLALKNCTFYNCLLFLLASWLNFSFVCVFVIH